MELYIVSRAFGKLMEFKGFTKELPPMPGAQDCLGDYTSSCKYYK